MSQKTVFISYRRDSTGKLFATLLKQALTHRGYDVFLDVDNLDAGLWEKQILSQVPRRAHFLLLLTPGSLERCTDEDDWVRREFLLAHRHGRNIVPVYEETVHLGKMRETVHASILPVFAYQAATIQQRTFESDVETLIANFIPPHKAPAETTPSFRADISRIIKFAPLDLIGREAETKLLSDAWEQAVSGEPQRPHILTFVALGGEGKTSLVAKWVAGLAHRDWPGCEAAFAWSFYSQGTKEQTAATGDLFLREALVFFGDPEMAASAQHASDKAKRLAHLVGEKRALLILDGVEPLQYSPTSPMAGKLKDDGLAALLKSLATHSHGLCVVTTRYTIPDLQTFRQTTAPEHDLKRLSTVAGVELLHQLGVNGAQAEFEKLVEDVRGHALTLNLLGAYLHGAHAGDIRKRDLVKLEEADAEEQGGHAFRVMDAYVHWFESEGKKGRRALAVLQLLGLFDRPASADCVSALLEIPAIPGLTEVFFTEDSSGQKRDSHPIEASQLNLTYTRLEAAKLLTVNREPAGTLIALDAHPLLREYFARQLRTHHLEAWRAAHRRLFEHLCATTKEGKQPTLEALQPLYQAVAHGCMAGMQREAREKVYRDRILRGGEAYSTFKLGAFGFDLGAVACFFEQPWLRVSPALTEADRAWLLSEAAFRLRALGRLTEALEPMRANLQMRVEREEWQHAPSSACNLSELELTLGDVLLAVANAGQSVFYADRSGDAGMRMIMRAAHADALHQAGSRDKALALFRVAEHMQAERQPDFPLLYSLQGFQYCDLLLAIPERAAWRSFLSSAAGGAEGAACRAVSQRVAQTIKIAEQNNWLLDIALDHLTQSRAALYEAILDGIPLVAPCHTSILHAVDGLRRAGQQHYLPRGLLTRAWLRSLPAAGLQTPADPAGAQADLNEAWEIAERGPMPLFMADIHLHRARLFKSETYPWVSPQADLKAARRLIEKHDWLRRMEELEDAERVILGDG